MELAGTGLDFYTTGRIVVFSNSVLFQTGTPLFKQITGTEYAWHEVVAMIAPDGTHKEAQEKLVAAVNAVYSPYREEIERQHAPSSAVSIFRWRHRVRPRAFSSPTWAWNSWSAIP